MNIQVKYRGIPFSDDSKKFINQKLRSMITNSLNSLICNFDKYDERFMSASIILNSKYGIFYAKAKDRSLNQVLDQVGKKLIKQITRKKAQTESFSQPDIQIEESNI